MGAARTVADAGWAGLVSLAGVSANGNVDVTVTQVLAAATSVAPGRVVGRIPALPANFVFRREFEALAKQVAASPVTVVTGMRGVGKTQLAAAYARAVLTTDDSELVGWIDAENSGTLLEGLASVAEQQGVADPDGDSYRSALRLRDHLNSSTRMGLLVFDNATDPDQISEFLAVLGTAKVLVTSTDHDFTTLGAALDLAVYHRPESVRYLHDATTHRTVPPDDAGAAAIAAELGDLPLALTQAAATITARRLNYTAYQKLLTGPMPRAFTRRRGDSHRLRVDTAIQLSIETTETPTGDDDLDVVVPHLLELVAMLSPIGVARTLLPDYGGRLDEAIARCTQGCLLSWSDDGQSLLMHRLIARVLRHRGDTSHAMDRLLGNAFAALEPHLFDQHQAWLWRAEGAQLIEHIEALTRNINQQTPRLFRLRNWAGQQLIETADFTRALNHLRRTLDESQDQLGPSHPETLATRGFLAAAYFGVGRAGDAVALYEQLLPDIERILGPDDLRTLVTRGNLAGTYQAVGKVGDAVTMLEQLLPDQERVLGPDHPYTLTTRNNLAGAYQASDRAGDAVTTLEQLLPDRERVLGPDHPVTLTTRSNLAGAYQAMDRAGEAVTMLEQLLPDQERVLGPDHPRTLTTRNNLAGAYQATDRAGDAVTMFEQLLTDRERVLGPDHPYTLTTRNNLAGAYREVGRTDEAITMHEQLLPDLQRVLGPDNLSTLTNRNNLATVYREVGRTDEAVTMFEQLLTDRERVLGPDHPYTLTTRNNLAG
ncbi:FxSxx-COOH system tetratricopeptide repeat protein, partial [Nocardia tengchongensis]|uniref:FxSxx-COOH system tetratricopeptide repeat protein n=1 Tax=Nocardia tengchongensis TaxID=2055889 RepID=UPI003697C987